MTGFDSKRHMAQGKLVSEADTLTIAYQSGFADGKKAAQPEQQAEPVAFVNADNLQGLTLGYYGYVEIYTDESAGRVPLYTAPPAAQRNPLTEREIELIDGMIEVQRDHAKRCDNIANRTMADKQKGWDMERVELLLKLKAAHNIKENT